MQVGECAGAALLDEEEVHEFAVVGDEPGPSDFGVARLGEGEDVAVVFGAEGGFDGERFAEGVAAKIGVHFPPADGARVGGGGENDEGDE